MVHALTFDRAALQVAFDQVEHDFEPLGFLGARLPRLEYALSEAAAHVQLVYAQILLQHLQGLLQAESRVRDCPLPRKLIPAMFYQRIFVTKIARILLLVDRCEIVFYHECQQRIADYVLHAISLHS